MEDREHRVYKVYLDYWETYGNLGDEAILITAIDRLNNYLDDCKIIIPLESGNPLPALPSNVEFVNTPRWTFRAVGRLVRIILHLASYVPYLKRFVPQDREEFDTLIWKSVDRILGVLLPVLLRLPTKLSKTVDTLKTCDVFYSVGGGGFNDFNLRAVVYKSWLYKIVKQWVRVSVVSSQGLGPVNNKWARVKLTEAFENIDFLSLREPLFSKSIVERLGLQNPLFAVVGDEAFGLTVGTEGQSNELLQSSGIEDGEPFIAIHFRATDYTRNTAFLLPRISALLDELCKIVPYRLIFFPMSYMPHSDSEVQCGSAIRELMSKPERLLLAPLCKDVRIVKGAIGKAKYSLGLSYHVHVFSLSQGKPAVILYTGDFYRYKSEGLIGFYGEPCSALDLEQVSIEEVLEAIQSLEDNYEAAVAKIAAVNTHIQDINDWHMREMQSRLERTG